MGRSASDSHGTILTDDEIRTIESLATDEWADGKSVLANIGAVINRGVSEGRFTQDQASQDLFIALSVAKGCKLSFDYESFWTAAEWLKDAEASGRGCGEWYSRYAESLMYTGRPAVAREYLERGAIEAPGDARIWYLLSILRHHYGDDPGSEKALETAFAIMPDRHILKRLEEAIAEGMSTEDMLAMRSDFNDSDDLGNLVDSARTEEERKAMSGWIFCDRESLDALKDKLGVNGWTSGNPYCSFMTGLCSCPVTLEMNEAFASKCDPQALLCILKNSESMKTEAIAHLIQKAGDAILTMVGLRVHSDLAVTLHFSAGGDREYDVAFDKELQLVSDSVGGPYAAILLLDDPKWDPQAILDTLRSRWGIVLAGVEIEGNSITGAHGEDLVLITKADSKVPGTEVEEAAQRNYFGDGMEDVLERYNTHIIVALVNHGGSPLKAAEHFLSVVDSCIRNTSCVGVYRNNVVYQTDLWTDGIEQYHSEHIVPFILLVWTMMYDSDDGICACTCGMEEFCREEIEIMYSKEDLNDVFAMMHNLVSIILPSNQSSWEGFGFEFNGTDYELRREVGEMLQKPCLRVVRSR